MAKPELIRKHSFGLFEAPRELRQYVKTLERSTEKSMSPWLKSIVFYSLVSQQDCQFFVTKFKVDEQAISAIDFIIILQLTQAYHFIKTPLNETVLTPLAEVADITYIFPFPGLPVTMEEQWLRLVELVSEANT